MPFSLFPHDIAPEFHWKTPCSLLHHAQGRLVYHLQRKTRFLNVQKKAKKTNNKENNVAEPDSLNTGPDYILCKYVGALMHALVFAKKEKEKNFGTKTACYIFFL